MNISEAVLLIECLMQGARAVEGNYIFEEMADFEDDNMNIFICSYIKPSQWLATTSLCNALRLRAIQVGEHRFSQVNILQLQYHFVYLRYPDPFWSQHDLGPLSKDRPGLLFERHSARIRKLSHSRTPEPASAGHRSKENSNYTLSEVHFEECRLSMSLYLYGKGGEFRLVIVGDKGAHVDLAPSLPFDKRHASSSLRFDPTPMGHLAGLTHFLVNLVHLLDTWHRGWKDTLDKIDYIVGFEVSTLVHENPPLQVLWKGNIFRYQ